MINIFKRLYDLERRVRALEAQPRTEEKLLQGIQNLLTYNGGKNA